MTALIRDIRGGRFTHNWWKAVTVRLFSARARVAPGSLSDVLIIENGGDIVADHESAGVLRLQEWEFSTDDYIYLGRCTINSDSTQPHLLLFRFDKSEIRFFVLQISK